VSFTINDFSDLLDIINTHPEWRQKLRQVLFPEIDIPQAFQKLTTMIERLDQRIEASLGQAAADREAIKQDVTQLGQRVETGFAEAAADREAIRQDVARLDQRMETGFAEAATDREIIKQDVSGLKQDVSGLKQDVSGLKQDVSGLKQDVSGLKQDVSGLKQDVVRLDQRMETGFAEAATDRKIIKQDVGTLKGRSHELFYQIKANAVFGRYLRRGREMTEGVADRLHEALGVGQISEAEYDQVMAADLLWGGQLRQTETEVILVLEASWLAEANDISRAVNRAAILRRIGLKALPVVAGHEWVEAAAEAARQQKVVLISNGHVDSASWQVAVSE